MKRKIFGVCVVFIGMVVICSGAAGQSSGKLVPLNQLRLTQGKPIKQLGDITIYAVKYDNGYVLDDYYAIYALDRKYDWFTCEVGMNDNAKVGEYDKLIIKLDGKEVFSDKYYAYQPPKVVKVRTSGAMRLTIERNDSPELTLINPRLITGEIPAMTSVNTSAVAISSPSAPFMINPEDIDKLAGNLRTRIDSKPTLKERLVNSNVALMTFTLLDINSPSVSAKLAENLSTALINEDIPLVERGQLDKVLKELKIQDSALIDPTTAQKIGKMSGCDIILVGSISDEGQSVVINCRLLDTATGKALAAERVEMRKIPVAR